MRLQASWKYTAATGDVATSHTTTERVANVAAMHAARHLALVVLFCSVINTEDP